MNTKRIIIWIGTLTSIGMLSAAAFSQDNGKLPDPFGGRLFAPNVILQHQNELELTDAQRQQIREIVLSTQATVSERQWDMRETYQEVMVELDRIEIDEAAVMGLVQNVLETENGVKLAQVSMLIRLRNLLSAEQLGILKTAAR